MAKIYQFPGRFAGGDKKEGSPEPKPEEHPFHPEPEEPSEPQGEVLENVVRLGSQPERRTPAPHRQEDPDRALGSAYSRLSLLADLARTAGMQGGMGHLFEELGIDIEKLDRLTRFRSHIVGLSGRGTGAERNIAIRRDLLREMTTEDLAGIFEASSEQEWTGKPSYYEALVGLLEERGYFDTPRPLTPLKSR